MLTGIWFSFRQVSLLQVKSLKKNQMKISALNWLAVGYLSFILPTTFVNLVNPATIEGIPSIMCGFAVLLAIVLIGFVAPLALEKRK